MITAEEARRESQAIIDIKAKTFLDDYVQPAIVKATSNGDFHTEVSLDNFENYQFLAKAVVMKLTLLGFDAQHVYHSDQRDYENYISIRWDKGVLSK